jgi:hypothetical protein
LTGTLRGYGETRGYGFAGIDGSAMFATSIAIATPVFAGCGGAPAASGMSGRSGGGGSATLR